MARGNGTCSRESASSSSAWVRTIAPVDEPETHALCERARDEALDLVPREACGHDRPGVVLFEVYDSEVCRTIGELSRFGEVRVLALYCSEDPLPEAAHWDLLQGGAADVLHWSGAHAEAGAVVARLRRWCEIEALVDSPLVRKNLVGETSIWRRAIRRVVEVARFTDCSVLVTGESGTGKELAARLIHTLDPRPGKQELVVLDCSTVVPELSGSEFFGHERGAFTGAATARDGAFALASGGTLFLDEVGELSPQMQAQLLRVIQERKYKRVGGNAWFATDFRLVCATNRDLESEVAAGRFRADLYYRLANWVCKLPPLRERVGDIPRLVERFLAELDPDQPTPEVTPPVEAYLLSRTYPGNVRELRQLVMRIRGSNVPGAAITVGDIPREELPEAGAMGARWRDSVFDEGIRRALALGAGLKELSQHTAETAIRIAIEEESGSLQRAAKRLGVTDRALQLRKAKS